MPPAAAAPPVAPPDLRIVSCHVSELAAKLLSPGRVLPLRLTVSTMAVTYILLLSGRGTVLRYAYVFEITDARDEKTASIELTYELVLATESDEHLGARDWERLAMLWPLKLVHDDLRGYLHQLTKWMGLPPLVLELFRKPELTRSDS